MRPRGFRRGAACNALAAGVISPLPACRPHGLRLLAPDHVPFLIISYALVARMGRPPLGPRTGRAPLGPRTAVRVGPPLRSVRENALFLHVKSSPLVTILHNGRSPQYNHGGTRP